MTEWRWSEKRGIRPIFTTLINGGAPRRLAPSPIILPFAKNSWPYSSRGPLVGTISCLAIVDLGVVGCTDQISIDLGDQVTLDRSDKQH